MQPSENDLASPEIRPYLDRYMRGKDADVEYKSRLFRLAHDLAASSFAMRQDIYEYWHGDDPNRNRINLMRSYDQEPMKARIRRCLAVRCRTATCRSGDGFSAGVWAAPAGAAGSLRCGLLGGRRHR
jgi:aromatic ring hydroxylase